MNVLSFHPIADIGVNEVDVQGVKVFERLQQNVAFRDVKQVRGHNGTDGFVDFLFGECVEGLKRPDDLGNDEGVDDAF